MRVDSDTGEVIVPFLRSEHNYDMRRASFESGLDCSCDQHLTKQSFAEEVDINTIVHRFGLTGELPKDLKVPQSGDFTEVYDFQTALNVVLAAERAFSEMPADVRKRFGNDPAEFMAFVHDDKNREEAAKLGLLLPPKEAPKPLDVRVIPDPVDEAKP